MEITILDITQSIGILGFILYMLAYYLLLTGKIEGTDNSYIVMNFMAATCVLVSLIHNFILASALIQICWIGISIVGLIRYNFLHNTQKLSE